MGVRFGDVDGDGAEDLLVLLEIGPADGRPTAGRPALGVMLQKPGGGYHAGVGFDVADDCMATGDFNGDGRTDVAVCEYHQGRITVFFGSPP